MPTPDHVTERQAKWFASVRASLERDTGKSIAQWADIARSCPETGHRARRVWMKAEYGIGQNQAALIFNEAFPPETSWSEPDALAQALWVTPAHKALFETVKAAALALPDTIVGQRKAFAGFSRKVQFAAVRPIKAGGVLLALPLAPDPDAGLAPIARKESWSERHKSVVTLASPADVDARVAGWLKDAWNIS